MNCARCEKYYLTHCECVKPTASDSGEPKPPADSKPTRESNIIYDGRSIKLTPEAEARALNEAQKKYRCPICGSYRKSCACASSAYAQLERERDELKAELTLIKLGQEFEAIANTKSIFRGEKIVQLLAEAEFQRDKYRAALERLLPTLVARTQIEIAREALK